MKVIKNESVRGLEIILKPLHNGEPKAVWLAPRRAVEVQDYEISDQLITLQTRKLVKITSK
jgi:hypothetical protein